MVLGFVAGISPGPIFALVITETLKHGKKEGIRLACVPLITDIPIIILSLLLLSLLADYNTWLGILTLLGAVFLLYLAYENLSYIPQQHLGPGRINSFSKGIIANFLSPHPYLFWILIGGPMIVKANKIHSILPYLFVMAFYLMLVGSKLLIAILVHKLKNILQSKMFIYLIRILGLVLILFAVILILDAVNYIF